MDCSASSSWCVRCAVKVCVRAHQYGVVQRLVQHLAVVVGVAVALVGHDVVHLHSCHRGWKHSLNAQRSAGAAAGGVQEAGRRRQKMCRLIDRHLVCTSAWPTEILAVRQS